ncbi:MAG: MerR family transcriptional regulator [Candidatus Kapabacteria bacterium]|nr:MerR family transcriptional regulator [Candidatus Kapabacteria bacterium]
MIDLPLMCLRKESLELFQPTAIIAFVLTLEHSLWLTYSYSQATTSMLINELAKRAGVSVHTIRFYERYGLVRGHRDPTITSNNHLHYDEESVDRLELILDAKSAGFTLQEISEIIDAWYKDTYTKREKRQILERKLQALDDKIKELRQMKKIIKDCLEEI